MLRFMDLKSYFTVVSLKDMDLSKDYKMTSIGDVLVPYLGTCVDAGVHVMEACYCGILIFLNLSHSF